MNRIKRNRTLPLSIALTFGLALLLGIGGVFAKNAVVMTTAAPDNYIYFDLAAGNVSITSTDYIGYVYVGGNLEEVSGQHTAANHYYVYQSNLTDETSAGYYKNTGYEFDEDFDDRTNCRVPEYTRVKNGVEPWTDFITNNTDVYEVSNNWKNAAEASGREATQNYIKFAAESNYTVDMTIDNIWSTKHDNSVARTEGGIGAHLGSNTNTSIMINLKGDNRLGCVHYHSNSNSNRIIFSDGETGKTTSGSLTVADFPNQWGYNHWNAVIGGNDIDGQGNSKGIVIESGVIYAGATWEDNCTAIGGGGNEDGSVTINGGIVTAVAATTGTAIGGGIGWGGQGGNADVTINYGTVYAYNMGIGSKSTDQYEHYVPAVAIGGGSSQGSRGNNNTTVTITGGNVYAQCMGGAAIGGGGSTSQSGGPATITISGGNIIAKSTTGTFKGTKDAVMQNISAGVSIGGGTGATGGGSVELNISGGTLRTGSVGGGKTTGSGNIGSANITIIGGNIVGQMIMAEGAAKNCSFNMSGGIIHSTNVIEGNTITDLKDPQSDVPILYLEKNGGAVWMDDPKGVTEISGGTIRNCSAELGGAIYMTGGTFTISDAGAIENNSAITDGGGVYVGGGVVKVNGGSISRNTAGSDGGGVYVGNGDVDVFGGSISNNTAGQNGGGAYIAGDYSMTAGDVLSNKAAYGGGIYVNDGVVTIYGGRIDSNSAVESGGGMFISSDQREALVDIFSGSISGNKSKSGGGMSVISSGDMNINVTLGVDCVHPDLNDGVYTPFGYPLNPSGCGYAHDRHTNHINGLTHSSCPQVKNNTASDNGGGFFLSSSKTYLTIYCITEEGNVANGNERCNNMDVRGGHVIIGDQLYSPTGSNPVQGNTVMQSSILVEGGTVDIYGKMENPEFTDDVTVDIKQNSDHYIDHRIINVDEPEYYKVHYYENFKGDNDTPTGLYIARQYPDIEHDTSLGDEKFDFTIMSSIFSHPGYKIVGWNTNPDGINGDEYEVNATYNLKELKSQDKVGAYNGYGPDGFDHSLLIIYAIWERSGYVLKFDPNVGKGETYTGAMENQRVTVGVLDGTQSINANQFVRPGYEFIGWTLTPTPTDTDTVYADGHIIKKDFTQEDGATVTLYAKWEPCSHVDSLTYTANENILTQSCTKCGGHSAKATISAVNSIYDGLTHPAAVNFSVNWLGSKPEISYAMAASKWDAEDEVDENWSAASLPLHAGSYTASITVEDVTAQTEYTISPIKWETPEAPELSFKIDKGNADNISKIVITSPTGANIMYKITSIDNSGSENPVSGYEEWRKEPEFAGIPFMNYYHFYAKRCADRDHYESDPSRSDAYLVTGGNIVYIKNSTGIDVVPDIGEGLFKCTVSADEGYHLRNYHDNLDTAVENAQPIPDADDAYLYEGGIQLTKIDNMNGSYKYTVEFVANKVAHHQLTLIFEGAVKNASVTHKVTDGQVFGNFNGKETSISRDSAFTARFTVSDYIPDEYTAQTLSFSKSLPAGTTIIMKADGGYWYYNLGETAESVIDLTKFTAMGGEEKFSFNTTENTSAKTFTYQFIVDFSKAANNTLTDNDSLEVSLVLTANPSSEAPTIPAAGNTQISLNIKKEAVFNLDLASVDGKSATLNCTYNPSEGAASIWSGRKTALVLTAPITAPADLSLTAVADGKTTLYTMNSKRQFIIPLDEIGTKEVKITLNSHLFSSTKENLSFDADWYVSQSSADKSPLNGYPAASCNVTFSCKKDAVPSVRIDGTKYLCHAGDTLNVTVNYSGIPIDGNITAYLQSKNGGQYVDTGAKVPILNYVGTSNRLIEFNMGRMAPGSYRIIVIVQESGANILQVPYYFVIA